MRVYRRSAGFRAYQSWAGRHNSPRKRRTSRQNYLKMVQKSIETLRRRIAEAEAEIAATSATRMNTGPSEPQSSEELPAETKAFLRSVKIKTVKSKS